MRLKLLFVSLATAFIFAGCGADNQETFQPDPATGEIPVIERKNDVKKNEIPFDDAIAGILAENGGAIAAGEPVQLPSGYRIISKSAGDLTGTGTQDLGVVVAQEPDKLLGTRAVYILTQEQEGNFAVAHMNPLAVFGSEEGGVLGDPFQKIEIINGALVLHEYGGSNFRWIYRDEFRYVKDQLILSDSQLIRFYTGTGNGMQIQYRYGDQSIQHLSYEESGKKEGTLIFEKHGSKTPILFDNFDISQNREIDNDYYLPSLGWYEYGKSREIKETKLSPNQALDAVQELHGKKLKKAKIPWTPETKSNYTALAGFHVADHYYQSKEGVVLNYFLQNEDTNGVFHTILLTDENNLSQFFKVMDETGEVIQE